MAIAWTALRSSGELGLTTSVFFARFVAMRQVEEGFGERIPAAVIRVYRVALTIAGEAGLRTATHLQPLPKRLTFSILRAGPVSLLVAGSGKVVEIEVLTDDVSGSRIDSPSSLS